MFLVTSLAERFLPSDKDPEEGSPATAVVASAAAEVEPVVVSSDVSSSKRKTDGRLDSGGSDPKAESCELEEEKKPLDEESDEDIRSFDTLEEEVAYLRRQNQLLREKVRQPKHPRSLLRRPVGRKRSGDIQLSPFELSKAVQRRLPEFLKCGDLERRPKVVFMRASADESEDDSHARHRAERTAKTAAETDSAVGRSVGDEHVATGDAEFGMEWWSVVDLEQNQGLLELTASVMTDPSRSERLVFPFSTTDDGGDDDDAQFRLGTDGTPFVLIREADVVDAVAYFVAQCVLRMPEMGSLTHEELTAMLDTTFSELRDKGVFGRMWEFSGWFYSIYGMSAYVWTIYANPALARLIAQSMWSAAWWLIAV